MKDNIEWIKYKKLILIRPELFSNYNNLEIILDEKIINEFESQTNKKIGVIYESDYNFLVVDLIKNGNSFFTYERIIPTKTGAVVIVPIIDDKFIILEQYRHSLRQIEYSFPRGFGENLPTIENTKKELLEEIGAIPIKIEKIGTLSADSGILSSLVEVYYCQTTYYEKSCNHEGILNIILLSEEEIKTWISDGKIIDNFTISAFYLFLQKIKNKHK